MKSCRMVPEWQQYLVQVPDHLTSLVAAYIRSEQREDSVQGLCNASWLTSHRRVGHSTHCEQDKPRSMKTLIV